ncbi:MAG: hypothetical protein MJK14_00010 [Rivularia sp. ALOHA_DT_140]|nr:hypothetical protein [Rivularia sp. ALOHA_DT_140]
MAKEIIQTEYRITETIAAGINPGPVVVLPTRKPPEKKVKPITTNIFSASSKFFLFTAFI